MTRFTTMSEEIDTLSQSMLDEVLSGLRETPKSLPSKFFYDEHGTILFEKITRLEEYYLTRTEFDIMRSHLEEIVGQVGVQTILVELGSGSSRKTRLLLDELTNIAGYVPVEISEAYLANAVQSLKKEYPHLTIKPVWADYTESFPVPKFNHSTGKYVLFYPGSTIGNFGPEEARRFLGTVSKILNPGGGMLIGVDLKKDKRILEAAYNDQKGITAAFNKNMLMHLNRELQADFNIDYFSHRAFYNKNKGRIEMHLVSDRDQAVSVAGEQIHFKQGESIHTENSYKYSLNEFRELVQPWFSVQKVWTDAQNYFSVQYLKKNGTDS